MTISANSAKSGPVAGDNSNATFTYAFPVLDAGDLIVILTNDKGEETRLSHPADFTATGIGDAAGGTVTLTTTPAIGESVTILRDMTAEQATDFVFQAGYLPREQEDALDRLTMVQQSQAEQLSRAVKVPASSGAAPDAFLQNHNNALLSDYAVKTINPALVIDPVRNIFIGDGAPTTLDTLLTHSRADTATFTDRNGILQTAAANELRNDHHLFRDGMFQRAGLRVDPASENLLKFSQDFSQSAWRKTNTTIPSSSEPAPDGTNTAARVLAPTSALGRLIQVIALPTTGTFTLSMYLKADVSQHALLLFNGSNAIGRAWFDLAAGTAGTTNGVVDSSTIEGMGDGWYRCSVTQTATGSLYRELDLRLVNGDGVTSSTANDSLLVWGAQLEIHEIPTAYIETGSSSVTRAADVQSIAAANMPESSSGFAFILEGFIDWSDNDNASAHDWIDWGTSTAQGIIRAHFQTLGSFDGNLTAVQYTSTSPDSTPANNGILNEGVGIPFKGAVWYKPDEVGVALNGNAVKTSHNSGLADPSSFACDLLEGFTGTLSKLRVFGTPLSEAALIEATTL